MQIPNYLEKLIHEGKAVYKTLSMGLCQQLVIPVKDKTYIVIIGYGYLPIASVHNRLQHEINSEMEFVKDEIQFVTFINDGNFFTFPHNLTYRNVTYKSSLYIVRNENELQNQNTYIIAKKDISVYFTRLGNGDLSLGTNFLQEQGPIFNDLGYGGLPAVTGIKIFNNAAGDGVEPLTIKYRMGNPLAPLPDFNQLTVIPNFGPLDMNSLTIEESRGKSRGNYFVAHYVEIFQEPPINVI